MRRRLGSLITLGLVAGWGTLGLAITQEGAPAPRPSATAAAAPAAPGPMELTEAQGLINRYCVTCHNSRLKPTPGELVLEGKSLTAIGQNADLWEKVLRKLHGGTMPPQGRPRPEPATFARLIGSLENGLDTHAMADPNPGRPMIHRLNRAEYANAIRDLLQLNIDGAALLPPDTSGFGFDNVADVLSMSPALLDRYMTAARSISRQAIGDPTLRANLKRYNISRLLLQEDRESESQSFGTRGGTAVQHHFPLDGDYLVRVDFQLSYNQQRTDVRGRHVDNQIDFRVDGELVKSVVVKKAARRRMDDGYGSSEDGLYPIEFRIPVKAGTHEVSVAFVKHIDAAAEGYGPSRLPQNTASYWWVNEPNVHTGKFEMGLTFLEIQGPFTGVVPGDTPTRRHVLTCAPKGNGTDKTCAQAVIRSLARRAYRRPPTAEEMKTLLEFYDRGQREAGFERGVQYALERVLVAPQFLFRVEEDRPNEKMHEVSDLELASRMSFFLWSSIPDEELLDVAERGQLSDPAVLQKQVQRMLADPKSSAMVSNFFGQWLWLRNMATAKPDVDLFPEFDDTLRTAFERETQLFIESQVHEDHGVLELLTADYTFVNERLAKHYGIPNVRGADFRRVVLTDGKRAGLLGHGSVLTVTSYPNRTSSVVRGKWLLENLLGTPPPEPPPDVPPFPSDEKGQAPRSVRATMEKHRTNPVCASCHSMLDPLGFSMENFDAVGKYRAIEADGVTPIDPSGTFPGGTKFDDPQGFRKALLERSDAIMLTMTTKLLTYALGRGAEYYDMPAVRKIVRDAAADDYRWSSMVTGIIKSLPFQMRRAES